MGRTKKKKVSLKAYLARYYSQRGKPKKIIIKKNILGQPKFRVVHFTDGTFITLSQTYDGQTWWRHRGGGRYGWRSEYEGKSKDKLKKRKKRKKR